MGLLSIVRKVRRAEREVRLLLLGLDNAGKTTLLRRFCGEDTTTIAPTLGFNIKTIEYNGYVVCAWLFVSMLLNEFKHKAVGIYARLWKKALLCTKRRRCREVTSTSFPTTAGDASLISRHLQGFGLCSAFFQSRSIYGKPVDIARWFFGTWTLIDCMYIFALCNRGSFSRSILPIYIWFYFWLIFCDYNFVISPCFLFFSYCEGLSSTCGMLADKNHFDHTGATISNKQMDWYVHPFSCFVLFYFCFIFVLWLFKPPIGWSDTHSLKRFGSSIVPIATD